MKSSLFSDTTRFILSVLAEFFIKVGIALTAALSQSVGANNVFTWPHPIVWIIAVLAGSIGSWSEVKAWMNK